MIFITSTTLLLEYPQTAHAFLCVGGQVKEYCIGYYNGAIQAHKDFNTEQDLDISRHTCIHNTAKVIVEDIVTKQTS